MIRSLILTTSLLACASPPSPSSPSAVERLGWLTGDWEHDDGQTRMVERWRAAPDGSLLGSGFVRVGPQVFGWAESLAIQPTADGRLQLTAWPADQEPRVYAVAVEGDASMIASRPGEAFPNRISYKLLTSDDGPARLQVEASSPAKDGGPPQQEQVILTASSVE